MSDERARKSIDDGVTRTLSSLDGLEDIDAGPYFFTRVRQRLADTQAAPGWGLWIRPVYIALILLLNLVTISVTLTSDRTRDTRTSEVAAFAQEYSLGSTGSLITLGGGQQR